MTCKMTVWLDHKRALVVTGCRREITTDLVELEELPSSRADGGQGARGVDPDQRDDARHAQFLQRYYDRIIELLARADQIHLMGPGQAKLELKRRIQEHKPLSDLPISLETVDRLTDPQIVARAREVFGLPRQRAARA